MRNLRAHAQTGERASLLLCRSYDLVALDFLGAEVRGGTSVGVEIPLLLATGFVPDGGCELLGCWPISSQCQGVDLFITELKLRGVERVKFLLGGKPGDWEQAVMLGFFGTTLIDPRGRLIGRAGGRALTALDISRICAAQEVTGRRRLMSLRAVARHGAFADPPEAVAFVVDSFRRVERDRIGSVAGDQYNALPSTSGRLSRPRGLRASRNPQTLAGGARVDDARDNRP